MNNLIISFYLFILSTSVCQAQKWILKDYKDDFGDPSGSKYLTQTVEGSYGDYFPVKCQVIISVDLNPASDFNIVVLELNGWPLRIPNMPSTERGGELLLRYKIGDKYYSIYVPKSAPFYAAFGTSIKVNYESLNSVIRSTNLPIKCIIAEETNYNGNVQFSNLVHFTLYPSNYKQVVR